MDTFLRVQLVLAPGVVTVPSRLLGTPHRPQQLVQLVLLVNTATTGQHQHVWTALQGNMWPKQVKAAASAARRANSNRALAPPFATTVPQGRKPSPRTDGIKPSRVPIVPAVSILELVLSTAPPVVLTPMLRPVPPPVPRVLLGRLRYTGHRLAQLVQPEGHHTKKESEHSRSCKSRILPRLLNFVPVVVLDFEQMEPTASLVAGDTTLRISLQRAIVVREVSIRTRLVRVHARFVRLEDTMPIMVSTG